MNTDRKGNLAAAFLDLDLEIGGRKLRRFTAGTMLALQQLGNRLFAEEETPSGAGQDGEEGGGSGERGDMEALLDLCGFIWVQTADLKEVIRAAEGGEEGRQRAREEAYALLFELGMEELTAFGQQFQHLKERIEAAMVVPKEQGGPGKPAPSPIGSPATSSISAGPETRDESGGSSGGCLLSEGSSTSTPGNGITVPGSGGVVPTEPLLPAEGTGAIPLPSLSRHDSDG